LHVNTEEVLKEEMINNSEKNKINESGFFTIRAKNKRIFSNYTHF
jgi:hypothetical protein